MTTFSLESKLLITLCLYKSNTTLHTSMTTYKGATKLTNKLCLCTKVAFSTHLELSGCSFWTLCAALYVHTTSKQDSSLLILFIHPCSNILYSLKIILLKALLLLSKDALFGSACLTDECSSKWMCSQPASKLMLLIKWLTELCVFLPVWFRMHQPASSHQLND